MEEEKNIIEQKYLRANIITDSSKEFENLYDNNRKTIEKKQDIVDKSICKRESESQNLTKNIIISDTNVNNQNLAVSESININFPSCIKKEIIMIWWLIIIRNKLNLNI